MQFFNYFRISLGLLNLSVFSFYCIIFSLFFFFLYSRHPRFSAAGDCGFLVYCVILYINIYTKKYLSQHSSANLQVIQFSQSIQYSIKQSIKVVYQGSLSSIQSLRQHAAFKLDTNTFFLAYLVNLHGNNFIRKIRDFR